MVRSRAARGGSWGLLGSLLAPLGVALGLRRCPRRLPEGPREGPGEPPGRHSGSIFAARPAGTKKLRTFCIYLYFSMLFLCCFCLFPSPSPLRRRKRVPRKLMKIRWFLQSIRRVGRFRAERKNKKINEKPFEKRLENASKMNAEKHAKNFQTSLKTHQKIPPTVDPGGLRSPLPSQLGAWSLPKMLPEPSGASKKIHDRARGRPGAPPERFFIEKKTWLSWNGKRERRESVKHCKRSKSRKSSGEEEEQEQRHREQQERKRSKSIPSCKPASLDNRGWALARALRARARPFEVGASRSLSFSFSRCMR